MECQDELTANVKCIIFTMFIVGVYFLPYNKWILLFLLWFPYLLMAWYDEVYNCQREFGPTYLKTFYSWAKPYYSKQNIAYRNLCPKQERQIFIVDAIVLIFLFYYIYHVK